VWRNHGCRAFYHPKNPFGYWSYRDQGFNHPAACQRELYYVNGTWQQRAAAMRPGPSGRAPDADAPDADADAPFADAPDADAPDADAPDADVWAA
jgi:hypothetical protein